MRFVGLLGCGSRSGNCSKNPDPTLPFKSDIIIMMFNFIFNLKFNNVFYTIKNFLYSYFFDK